MKIIQKLTLGFTTILLILILGLSFTSFLFSRSILKETALEELTNTNKSVIATIETVIDASIYNYLRAISEKNRDIVSSFYEKYKVGELPEKQLRKIIQDILLSQKVGITGYNFVFDIKGAPEEIIFAIHPKTQGINGAAYGFVQNAYRIKDGYQEYEWKNPDETDLRKKAMYVSYFEPWHWLIGTGAYKSEFINLVNVSQLRQALSTIKIGQSGYVFVMDIQGNVIIHPKIEGQNIYNVQSQDGEYFVRRLIQQRKGIGTYKWQNPDDDLPRTQIVSFDFFEKMDWIIGVAAYEDELFRQLDYLRNVTLVALIIVILLGVLIPPFVIRPLIKPLVKMTYSADKIAKGDLTLTMDDKALKRQDEVGNLARAFRDMLKNLNHFARYVLNSANHIASTTQQISDSSQNLSQATLRQAVAIEQISSAMEEIAATIKENSAHAGRTENIASKSTTDAEESSQAVQQVVQVMNNISEKITEVREIARQTNLLSLNASIEAARVGKEGKGFSVVAMEIQKLAGHSQTAANDISQLISSSVHVALKAKEMLVSLLPDIKTTTELVSEISAASHEQDDGTQQINQNLQQINSVVQGNAASAEQLAATVEELNTQAAKLKELVCFFKTQDTP